MDALELDVRVILLEVEVHEETEVDVWSLDAVLVLPCLGELVEVEHLGEHLHFVFLKEFKILIIIINYKGSHY